jgi:hypothetical protein
VRGAGHGRWSIHLPVRQPVVPLGMGGYRLAPLTYAYNELTEMLSIAHATRGERHAHPQPG